MSEAFLNPIIPFETQAEMTSGPHDRHRSLRRCHLKYHGMSGNLQFHTQHRMAPMGATSAVSSFWSAQKGIHTHPQASQSAESWCWRGTWRPEVTDLACHPANFLSPWLLQIENRLLLFVSSCHSFLSKNSFYMILRPLLNRVPLDSINPTSCSLRRSKVILEKSPMKWKRLRRPRGGWPRVAIIQNRPAVCS